MLQRGDSNPGMLCVAAPSLGIATETYIQRHLAELLPGRTVGLSFRALADEEQTFASDQKILCLARPKGVVRRTCRNVLHSVSLSAGWWFDESNAMAFLTRHRVRVVLAEFLPVAVQMRPLCRRLGIPLLAHAHGNDVSGIARRPGIAKEYLSLNEIAGVIVVSAEMKRSVQKLGIQSAPIHVIPCGVEWHKELPVPDTEGEVRRSQDSAGSHNSIVVTFVGRLIGKKSPIFLLDSFRRAHLSRPDLKLNIVGDGELMSAAIQFTQAFGLESHVLFHGRLVPSKVASVLRTTDIYMQHSCEDPLTGDSEGLPVSILEAMAMGLPVVATRHAGIPEAVEDGSSGFLVPPGDTATMAERLVQLVDDSSLRRRFGARGASIVADKFTWDIERATLLSVLNCAVLKDGPLLTKVATN